LGKTNGNASLSACRRNLPGIERIRLVRLDQAQDPHSDQHGTVRVRDAVTRRMLCCTLQTTLGAAAVLMEEGECGTFPIVRHGETIGMITDRDICVGLAAAQCLPSELPVADIMSETLYSCREGDDLSDALETMRRHRVRRLPVLDREGALCGLLSIDDVLALAGDAGDGSLSERDALAFFQEICHRARGPRTLSEPAPRP